MGSIVIMGGLHAVSCPDEVLAHADAIAVGDGVQLWPRILHDIERNQLQRVYNADFSRPYAADPPPRRDLLPRESFLTTTSVIATRGCHNRCGFCYLSTDGLHVPYRIRFAEQVVAEIAADDQPYAVFVDNNLGSRRDYLRQLCAALRPLERREPALSLRRDSAGGTGWGLCDHAITAARPRTRHRSRRRRCRA